MDEDVESFIEEHRAKLAPKSLIGCRSDLKILVDFLVSAGASSWGGVRKRHIEDWATECATYGVATQRARLHWTRRFLQWLHDAGRTRARLMDAVPAAPSTRPQRDHLPFGQRDKLLHVLPEMDEDVRALALAWLVVSTGCKTSEARDLNVGDVSLDKRTVVIRAGQPLACMVEIDAQCAANLEAWMKVRARLQTANRNVDDEALFVGVTNGIRVGEQTLQGDIRRLAAQVDIEGVTPTALRNTAYIQFRVLGKTPTEVREIMGLTEYSVAEIERSLKGLGFL